MAEQSSRLWREECRLWREECRLWREECRLRMEELPRRRMMHVSGDQAWTVALIAPEVTVTAGGRCCEKPRP